MPWSSNLAALFKLLAVAPARTHVCSNAEHYVITRTNPYPSSRHIPMLYSFHCLCCISSCLSGNVALLSKICKLQVTGCKLQAAHCKVHTARCKLPLCFSSFFSSYALQDPHHPCNAVRQHAKHGHFRALHHPARHRAGLQPAHARARALLLPTR